MDDKVKQFWLKQDNASKITGNTVSLIKDTKSQ